jgi:transposase
MREVHATQINKWKQQAIESMQAGFTSNRGQSKDDDQSQLVDKLYRQIGKLSTECEWLKKKSEVFKF